MEPSEMCQFPEGWKKIRVKNEGISLLEERFQISYFFRTIYFENLESIGTWKIRAFCKIILCYFTKPRDNLDLSHFKQIYLPIFVGNSCKIL